MRTLKMIKTIIFVLLGIFLLVCSKVALEYLPYTIGFIMTLYAVFKIVGGIIKHNLFKDEHALFEGLILLLFAFVMMFMVKDNFVTVCIIWGTWSILREAAELTEDFERLMQKGPGLLSIIESIIVIVLSVSMIAHPTEHHAHIHIYLLGIELLLEVILPQLYGVWYMKHPKPVEEHE